jgi:hypothetical protein
MIPCYRAVASATADDDLQPPGSALAEAVQLTRDPSNIKRLVDNAIKKLTSSSVVVRVKALRFLNHIAQNGPTAVIAEIRLNTTAISDTMGFRGPPHPTRGYEPYQEMKDAAQTLLDMSFAASSARIESFSSPTTSGAPGPVRTVGYSTMESYGNLVVTEERASLESRSMDPNQRDRLGEVTGFFKRAFSIGSTVPTASKYGSDSNVPGTSQMATGVSTVSPEFAAALPPAPPPKQGLMDRLNAPDANWSKKKPANPLVEKPKAPTDTPVAKLLKVTGGKLLPTNAEISAFRGALTVDSLAELKAGLGDSDWKVKVRAITGLECFGEKYGYGTVADLKAQVSALKAAPQASLRTAAGRFFEAIKNEEPVPLPEEPSAFDLGGGEEEGAEEGFDFAS